MFMLEATVRAPAAADSAIPCHIAETAAEPFWLSTPTIHSTKSLFTLLHPRPKQVVIICMAHLLFFIR